MIAQPLAASALAAPVLAATAPSGSTLLWYTTRATGIVALVLLTGTVVLGVVGTARAASARWPRIVTAQLHRNLALTSAAFVAIHVLTTLLDPFAPIGLSAVFLPFASAYRPFWLSLGAVAFDLLAAVLVTSLLRERLSHRAWRATHLLVYACWPIAIWHGLGTGTDSRLIWVIAIDVACVAAVGWAIWWRLSFTENLTARVSGWSALVLFPLATLIFVLVGPLQPGWAQRAGTPVALLGNRSAASSASPSSAGTGRLVNARFTAHLSLVDGGQGRTITITGHTTSAPRQAFVIVLHGAPAGGGISLSSGTVRIGSGASAYTGPVTALSGSRLTATVQGAGSQRRARFTLNVAGSTVTGTISLLAGSQE